MKKLLHIIASPRGDDSRTLRVSEAFLEVFRAERADWVVEDLDLFRNLMVGQYLCHSPPLSVGQRPALHDRDHVPQLALVLFIMGHKTGHVTDYPLV